MPKKKKATKKLPTRRPAPISRRLRDGLAAADALHEQRRFAEARALLDDLLKDHPDNVAVLRMLAKTAAGLDDVPAYQFACERLHRLCPRDTDLPFMLAVAYLKSGCSALALDMARRALAADPAHPRATTTRQMVARLEPLVIAETVRLGLDGPDELELMILHDRVRALIAQEHFAKAREVAQQLIARRPRFAPAYNNGADACCADGAVALAVDLTQRVLAYEPDNLFALANLTRFFCMLGNMDDARACARRLRALTPASKDQAAKQAEAFAFLGDDAGVLWAVAMGLPLVGAPGPDNDALLHHLAAVACVRQGRAQAAREHWDAALRAVPDFAPARENLDDLEQPAARRNGPWSFPFCDLMSKKLLAELLVQVAPTRGTDSGEPVSNKARWFLAGHPELDGLVALLLDRGDAHGRDFALLLAGLFRTPAMLQAVREFAVSERGADQLRIKAVSLAQQAGLFPDEPPSLWLDGVRSQNPLYGIEVHNTPVENAHAPGVFELIKQGVYAMQDGDPARGERALRRALAIDPDDPMVMNNLAVACAYQGRTDESEALSIRLHERHPDYLFGRTALASLAAERGDMQRARALLEPLLKRKKMHVTEMSSLCLAHVNLLLHEGERDQARSWLTILRQVAPGHPAIPGFAAQLGEE